MSASTARFATGLARPRRQWVRWAVVFAVLVVAAFGLSEVFGGLTGAVMHKFLGKIDTGASQELRVTPPSPWPGITPTPAKAPPPAPPAPVKPEPKPDLHQVLQHLSPAAAHTTSGSHDIDAFAKIHQTNPARPPSSDAVSHQPRPSRSEIASAAFGGHAKGVDLPGGQATAVQNLDLTLRPGTRIPCILQNAIDTTTGDGSFTCVVGLPGNQSWPGVASWNGLVTLLPSGTQIVGTYKALQNGRDRIFAVGAYATGDDGLVVPLGSPVTDAEGRMGANGEVQSNWWPRMRTGLILDLAQTAFGAVPALIAHGNNNSYLNLNTGGTDQAIAEALHRDADIPDVLKKNQGETIYLLVTQPVFFQDAIKLELRGRR